MCPGQPRCWGPKAGASSPTPAGPVSSSLSVHSFSKCSSGTHVRIRTVLRNPDPELLCSQGPEGQWAGWPPQVLPFITQHPNPHPVHRGWLHIDPSDQQVSNNVFDARKEEKGTITKSFLLSCRLLPCSDHCLMNDLRRLSSKCWF